MRKGQGRRTLLDTRGLRALRHCITHRHDSVIEITKWAQEYFQKPLPVNTIHNICSPLNVVLKSPSAELACSPDISPIENICCIITKKNTSKTTTNSSAAGNLYQTRMGPNSNTKTPDTHNLDVQTSSNCFEKKRRCYTMLNIPCHKSGLWSFVRLPQEVTLSIILTLTPHITLDCISHHPLH